MPPAPQKLQPALYGGVFIGVLSALPLINFANCCCLWVIGGGVLATYLLQQNHPYPVNAADGALTGLLAGLFGGILGVVLSIPIQMAMGPVQQQLIERLILSNPDVPEESKDLIRNMAGRGVSAVATAFNLILWACVGSIFGMLGGLLGVALFKKKDLPPPGTTEVLPPA
jgi:hypothetical protein